MATQARSNRFSSELPTDIDVIINELGELDHLDLLGVDLDVTRRDLDRFKRGALNDFDRTATRGERVVGLLHERLKNSVTDQVLERILVNGDEYPKAEINGLVETTLRHVAQKHYETSSNTDKGYSPLSDLSNPKNPLSDTLSLAEKEYIVGSLASLSEGNQQAIAQSLSRAKRLRSLPFNATLSLIDTATKHFAVDAKVTGLPYDHINSNHFPDALNPALQKGSPSDVEMIMGYVENSRHFAKLPLEFDAIRNQLDKADAALPDGVSGRIKLATLHQVLENATFDLLNPSSSGQILSVDMAQDARNGLYDVAKTHYNMSSTAESFIPTYSMHTSLTHAPLPDSLSANQYNAIAASTSHLSHGARQYVAANLVDQKSQPNFDFNKSIDVIQRSLQAFDGAIAHIGMQKPSNALARFNNDIQSVVGVVGTMDSPAVNAAHTQTNNPSPSSAAVPDKPSPVPPSALVNELMTIVRTQNFNSASKLDLDATQDALARFDSRIAPDTTKPLRMSLLHHELESMAVKNTKKEFAGKTEIHGSENPAYEAAMKATKNESFYTAREHYDKALTDTKAKQKGFIRFVARGNDGHLKKAPFPNAISTQEHDTFLKTMKDFTQGQKQLIASSVRDLTEETKGTKPELVAPTIKAALATFDKAYRHASPNNYIDSVADFDIRHTLVESSKNKGTKPPNNAPISTKSGSKPANTATKYDFGDSYANTMLDGISKEGVDLKKMYNDPKSTTDMLYNGTKNLLRNIDMLSGHAAHLTQSNQGDEKHLGLIGTALNRVGDIKDSLSRDAGRKGFLNEAGNISLNANFEHTQSGIDNAIKLTESSQELNNESSLTDSVRPINN